MKARDGYERVPRGIALNGTKTILYNKGLSIAERASPTDGWFFDTFGWSFEGGFEEG